MENNAELTGEVYMDSNPDKKDWLFFLLQDKDHRFTIGLSDILACLKFAEKEGEVPKLPSLWWSEVETLYPKLEECVDVPEEKTDETI